jgi:hypothetical protein
VALAESGGDTDALGVNDKGTAPTPPPVTWGSYDCGLWQVNNYWHGAKMVTLNWRDPVPAPVVNVTTQQVDLSGLEAQVAEVRSKFA